jgi:hypothetical protein
LTNFSPEASWGDPDLTAAEPPNSPQIGCAEPAPWTRKWPGWLVLWSGWLIPQIVLLGPALIGRTVDLPVDLLAFPKAYLPDLPEYADVQQHGRELVDLVFSYPEARAFSAKELRAGRLPVWQPANFAGAPFADWPIYSPFEVPYYLAPFPVTLAWIALLRAVTVGLGMWLLLRRCFDLSYWPSAIGSWCAPLTGFITLWHGFVPGAVVCWLPWSLLAVHGALKYPWGYSSLGVAVVTALLLLTGHPGMGGLVLLTTGLYFLWMLASELLVQRRWKVAALGAAGVGLGWLVGFLIAAPYVLPILQYGRTGIRMEVRAQGFDERPPEGLAALPAILWPNVNGGETHVDMTRTIPQSSLIEGASGAYAGLLAALWLAPLAWRHRRLRGLTVFLTVLVIVSLGWTLNVPGIIDVLRSRPLRPLASLSYNRWVFATSFAILILAAIGLDSLCASLPKFRGVWAVPMVVTAGFFCWCLYRLFSLTQDLDDQGFSTCFLLGAGLCLAAMAGWATVFRVSPFARWVRVGVICLLPLELFWFAWNERRQADRTLYFPRVPVLEKLAALPAGRIWGVACLQPTLNQTQGLEDIRGYDGVDPRNFIRLFELSVDRQHSVFLPYARTQLTRPAARETDRGLKLQPVADLLNVRYLIFREVPREGFPVILHQDDYWITENRDVLPRVYVPRSVRVVDGDQAALAKMASFDFDPRQTAFVTDDLGLPDAMQGQASVRYDTPTRTQLEVDMETPGLVLLSDLWDAGWRAQLDGAACPIYRVDVALRGFRVPAGKHRIVCTYDPDSVRTGFRAAATGGAILLLWSFWMACISLRTRARGANSTLKSSRNSA